MSDAVFDYMTGQLNPSQPALLAAFERESAEAVASLAPQLDIPYGAHPRQRFDLFRAAKPRGTIAYLHAGYWQSRDKAPFRFLAPDLVATGLHVALVTYPLCPEVTLAALTDAASALVPMLLAHAGRTPRGLIVAGHSAGAHLAAEIALRHADVAGIVALSGVYDLSPLLDTPLNDRLRLDRFTAAAASPIHRVRNGLPPALFAVGDGETEAFQQQTIRMTAAWRATGNPANALFVPDADHFSLLRSLQTGGVVFDGLMAMTRDSGGRDHA